MGENSVKNLELSAERMAAKYKLYREEYTSKFSVDEDTISQNQIKAYETMKKLDKDMYINFSASRPNEALKGATTIEERAKRIVISKHVNGILKADIKASETTTKIRAFTENNINREAEKLAKNPAFIAVQNASMKKSPDMGATAWKQIEDASEAIRVGIVSEIDTYGDVARFLNRTGKLYKPLNDTKEARQNALREVCKKVSNLLVRQALAGSDGTEILNLMALEGNTNRIKTMVDFATEYLMNKKTFEPSKNHDILDKLSSGYKNELADDILKAYKKTNPRPEVDNQKENNATRNKNTKVENKTTITKGK